MATMGRTGWKVKVSGQYQHAHCGQEIACGEGERFPPCPTCETGAQWTLVTRAAQEQPIMPEPEYEPEPLPEADPEVIVALRYIGGGNVFIAGIGLFTHGAVYTAESFPQIRRWVMLIKLVTSGEQTDFEVVS